MPWCPKCEMEYKDGMTVCADCGSPLVPELDQVPEMTVLAKFEKEEAKNKLTGFLEYSGIKKIESEFNEEEQLFIVQVDKPDRKQAAKLYHAFVLAENESESPVPVGSDSDEESSAPNDSVKEDPDGEPEHKQEEDSIGERSEEEKFKLLEETKQLRTMPATTYVKKKEEYEDLKSSASTFLLFGILGIGIIILNATKVLSFLNGLLPYFVLAVLCCIFIAIGISSYRKAKKVKGQISEEEELTKVLNQWMEHNINEQVLASIQDDSLTDEINYFNKIQYVRDSLEKQFGEMDESYLDQIIEEFYNSHFEN